MTSTPEPADSSHFLGKLEVLKEIRVRTVQLDKIKKKLTSEVEATVNEERCLDEYRTELEQLIQEKMAHVEELRQIHQDINAMEQVIKQAQEERNRRLDLAKQLNHEVRRLKDVVDSYRGEIGLTKLPEVHDDEPLLKPEFFERQRFDIQPSSHQDMGAAPQVLPVPTDNPILQQQQQQLASAVQQMRQRSGIIERPQSSAAFRQQPPPMKSCLSCHQQIHRNAPICPLCKAKSRSRNPKKPKRKMED
ncbi:zinc finger C4H2 domain-containing protein [Galendromus occidentalis]|uniref:Zinc finger C4H2 domain-containing protein n=1 Tax=Galendromus occidentalis TaxID=34638 RepID=A0AAJ6QVJ1_9ACAR|nr:zinc finger C4H2 domain-containing protein [Galendromus occidentalis]